MIDKVTNWLWAFSYVDSSIRETRYIASTLDFNVLLCLYATQALRTSCWSAMSRLDFMDLTSVIAVAWKGEMNLANSDENVFRVAELVENLQITSTEQKSDVPSNMPIWTPSLEMSGRERAIS
ncbi:hypothetical protein LTR84_006769 [Exophiala bonariae]|uniref:Transcription factor domain-containing protein n=1 Tax=Exophiala bonariae TaxID=1690606 RepID=A0AAV9N3M1_9EURO|nr:hypothetical protein LTR84_006769 [Exophiala bonariae]